MALNFGLANDYNVFVFGNMTMSNTDAEGRVAVGGNAQLTNFGIGTGILPLPPAGTDPSFVVDGDINVTGGSNASGNTIINPGSTVINYTMGNPNGLFLTGTPIDFSEAERYLKCASLFWGSLLPNGIDAVCFDQGALIVGLVPVPLHIIDTPANCAYILEDSDTKLLVTVNRARWHAIQATGADLSQLRTVVYIDDESEPESKEVRSVNVAEWLKEGESVLTLPPGPEEEDLAALVYTSGTTGKPKGVMLTHKNIMSDISALLYNIAPNPSDTWLSFLPLSHTFERTTSYYIGLGMGNKVTFSRGVARILDDLKLVRPSIMMSVPRVFEKVAAKINERLKQKGAVSRLVFNAAVDAGYRNFCRCNGLPVDSAVPAAFDRLMDPLYDKLVRNQIKNSFGGRMRVAVSGGAALSPEVAKTIIGLGIEIFQGYGMTETSPIISVNKIGANHPDTVGPILEGIEAKLGEKDELLVRGPQVMRGYWKRPEDTFKTLDPEGWLSTGDQADILPGNYLKIKGRIKEIIVTSTGEKVPPVDIEQAIETDPLFDQAMVYGDNRPFIVGLLVLNKDNFERFVVSLNLDPKDPEILTNKAVIREILKRIKTACKSFPQYH